MADDLVDYLDSKMDDPEVDYLVEMKEHLRVELKEYWKVDYLESY